MNVAPVINQAQPDRMLRLVFLSAVVSLVASFAASAAPIPLYNINHLGRRVTAIASLGLLLLGCLLLLLLNSLRDSPRSKKMTLDHPIFTRWPAQYPDRLQLFSAPTPNGVKVGIMLEETGLEYEPHRIDILADESHDPAFLALNPNGKIPAIYDPDGPSGRPLALFESGAILLYLADKTGRFISVDPNTRYETLQWLMWQMGGVGPMFGQVGFFNKFAGKAYEDKRPRDRYATESARLLGVLDERLTGRDWVMGADYSIADVSLLGWVRNLIGFYEARELVGFDRFLQVQAWLLRGLARPAVQRGLAVTAV